MSFIKRSFNRIWIILRDYYIDLRIQKRLIGDRRIESIDREYGVNNWQSTTYDAVNDIFFKYKYVSLRENDVIVDVGCGDAKLINFLLYKGVKNKMLGYEINKTEGAKTKKSLKNYKNAAIFCEDIFDDFPVDGTLFYLFNPFDGKLLQKFIDNIIPLKGNAPVIIYNNPAFLELFDKDIFSITVIELHQYRFANGKLAIIRFND